MLKRSLHMTIKAAKITVIECSTPFPCSSLSLTENSMASQRNTVASSKRYNKIAKMKLIPYKLLRRTLIKHLLIIFNQ